MPSSFSELEGGARLEQIRRIKTYLYLIQLMVVFAAVIFLVFVGGGMVLKPLYIQTGSFLYFLILMGLVVGVEGFFFRWFEIRFTMSSSTKYYMVKRSMRRAFIIMAISAAVVVLIVTPFLSNAIANSTSEAGTTSSMATFNNKDPLGLTSVDMIRVSSEGHAEVLVIEEEYYREYIGNIEKMRQYSVVHTYDAGPGISLDFPLAPFGTYYILVFGDEVSYTVHRALSPVFINFVSIFAIAFIGVYAAWVFYLTTYRKKHTAGAIYR